MMLSLEVQARQAAETTEMLRSRGAVPAVFYGPKQTPTPISIDARKLESIWKQAGETTIITLSGVDGSHDTLIHDVQIHPVTGKVIHADFYVLEKGKKVEISIPLEFVGTAPAEKLGHIISKALHEIEIEVAATEIPHTLSVDLSQLTNAGDHITAGQIKLPASASLKIDADEIVASVTEHKEEKEETPAADAAAPVPESAPAEKAE